MEQQVGAAGVVMPLLVIRGALAEALVMVQRGVLAVRELQVVQVVRVAVARVVAEP